MRSFFRNWLPPFLLRRLKARFRQYGWRGNYRDWGSAAARCTGYDSLAIIDKVAASVNAVRCGQAAHERDSVLFDAPQYSWPLLAALMHVCAVKKSLRVLDFGGSLGSGYYQNRRFLEDLKNVSWYVVEQPRFVERGRVMFPNGPIRFYGTVEAAVAEGKIDVVVMSSVLQYLEKPYETLKEVALYEIPFLVIDRTGFCINDRHRISVQRVHPSIYPASYPCHVFSGTEFEAALAVKYSIMAKFKCDEDVGDDMHYGGYIAVHKDSEFAKSTNVK